MQGSTFLTGLRLRGLTLSVPCDSWVFVMESHRCCSRCLGTRLKSEQKELKPKASGEHIVQKMRFRFSSEYADGKWEEVKVENQWKNRWNNFTGDLTLTAINESSNRCDLPNHGISNQYFNGRFDAFCFEPFRGQHNYGVAKNEGSCFLKCVWQNS